MIISCDKNYNYARVLKKVFYRSDMSTTKASKSLDIAEEIRKLNLRNSGEPLFKLFIITRVIIDNFTFLFLEYWTREPNLWGTLSDWDINYVNENPGCTKEEAHRNRT